MVVIIVNCHYVIKDFRYQGLFNINNNINIIIYIELKEYFSFLIDN